MFQELLGKELESSGRRSGVRSMKILIKSVQFRFPIIDGWIRLNQFNYIDLYLMQDGAPDHTSRAIYTELQSRGIKVISLPAFSPDLNPFEIY